MIRLARPDDVEAISRIARDAYQIYVARLGRAPAPMVADFQRHIEQDWVIVAERDGKVAGYAILIAESRRALLDNIAVDTALQRSGLGRLLIDRIEQKAADLGHDSLELYTNIVMTENIGWYERLGFVETRRVTEKGFHRIYMSKVIGSDAGD